MRSLKFLRWFCKPEYLVDIEGDLLEMYEKRSKNIGQSKANWLLWRDVIFLFRPGMIRTPESIHSNNMIAITHHNILISLRNFTRNKTAFFINLGSLTSGLVCALLIYLWVADEVSMDKFHENDARLYRVNSTYMRPTGPSMIEWTPSPLAEAMVAEFPEVERAVSMSSFRFTGVGIVSYENKQFKTEGFFASKDFFKVFSYPILLGDNSGVMISKSLAERLFGSNDAAIGKMVEWNNRFWVKGPHIISGVFEDVPKNSTEQFEIVFDYKKMYETDVHSDKWNGGYAKTILLLRDGVNIDEFNKKIAGFLKTKEQQNQGILSVSLYSDKYLADGRIYYVRLFSLVAIFTLAIACINFVNLSTAQASRKMKEVGVKKTFGVSRATLIGQFLSESVMLAMMSLVLALLIAFILLPDFNQLTGKHLELTIDSRIFLITLMIGIAAGVYPAFFLSGFRPASILKGKIMNSSFAEVFTRKGLVIMQFTVSVIFIIGFMIINKQIEFVQSKNLGYDKENVVTFSRRGEFDWNNYETLIREIKSVPGVVDASSMMGSVVNRELSLHNGLTWEGADATVYQTMFPYPPVCHDWVETMGIELKEGRTFKKDLPNEDTKMIINETAAKMIGFEDPIGKIVMYGPDPKEIIGVVKDFKYGSLHTAMEPVFFEYRPINTNIVVRLANGSPQATLEQLQIIYQKFHPGYPFEFTFLDDDYKKLYESDTKVSMLSTYFAILATLISCLGLFGLAVFSSEQRTKEIGIRKVLGATTSGIVRLLANDLVRPVFVSILIAIPVSFFAANSWLEGFAYKIELSWWFFAIAGVIAIALTWFTVALQTVKAARANPVSSLKSE
ncbi:MAG: ABC transporter permease [Bacteroidota bacterium]